MIVRTTSLNNGRILHQYRGSASNQNILEDHANGSTYLIDCGMPSDASLDKVRNTPGILSIWPGHGNVHPFDYEALGA